MLWEPQARASSPFLDRAVEGKGLKAAQPRAWLSALVQCGWVGGMWPSGLAKGQEWKKKDQRIEQEPKLLGLVTELDFLLRVKGDKQGNVMQSFTCQGAWGGQGSGEVTQLHVPSQQHQCSDTRPWVMLRRTFRSEGWVCKSGFTHTMILSPGQPSVGDWTGVM